MAEAFIVGAVRSAIGKKSTDRVAGGFALMRADELLATVLRALVDRVGLEARAIEDVIAGCFTQVGEQGVNIARVALLTAGLPDTVAGVTLNRMCGSSQQAVNFAAMGVMSAQHDVVIGCGVESMNRTPLGTDAYVGPHPWLPGPAPLIERYGSFHTQGEGAERVCEKWKLTREECDAFGVESHRRAAHAQSEGRFEREIVPIDAPAANGGTRRVARDEGVRATTSIDAMELLAPAFRPNGVLTAGSSSQISDGAAAVMVASERAVREHGLRARARIVATAVAGDDVDLMLTAPIPATRKVLARARLPLSAMDVIEINEAFSSVVLAWAREVQPDMTRVNPNGGAIALGHPLGASGARLITSCLHELERTGGRYGLVTMCIGFGQATATIIERLP